MHTLTLTLVTLVLYLILYIANINFMHQLFQNKQIKRPEYRLKFIYLFSFSHICVKSVFILKLLLFLPWNTLTSMIFRRYDSQGIVEETSAAPQRSSLKGISNVFFVSDDRDDVSQVSSDDMESAEETHPFYNISNLDERSDISIRLRMRKIKFHPSIKKHILPSVYVDDQINSRRRNPIKRSTLFLNKLKFIILPALLLGTLKTIDGVMMVIVAVNKEDGKKMNILILNALIPLFSFILCSIYPLKQSEHFNLTKFILLLIFICGILFVSVDTIEDLLNVPLLGSSIFSSIYIVLFTHIYTKLLPCYQDICLFLGLYGVCFTVLASPGLFYIKEDMGKIFTTSDMMLIILSGITLSVIGEFLFIKSSIISSAVVSSLGTALTALLVEVLQIFLVTDRSVPDVSVRAVIGYILSLSTIGPIILLNLYSYTDPLDKYISNILKVITRGSDTFSTSTVSNLEQSSQFSIESEETDYILNTNFTSLAGSHIG